MCVSLLINIVLVHPSQYTLAPPVHNWFLLHCCRWLMHKSCILILTDRMKPKK